MMHDATDGERFGECVAVARVGMATAHNVTQGDTADISKWRRPWQC